MTSKSFINFIYKKTKVGGQTIAVEKNNLHVDNLYKINIYGSLCLKSQTADNYENVYCIPINIKISRQSFLLKSNLNIIKLPLMSIDKDLLNNFLSSQSSITDYTNLLSSFSLIVTIEDTELINSMKNNTDYYMLQLYLEFKFLK